LVAAGIGTLIIGQKPLWKQKVTLGRRTNQPVVAIAHARFVALLRSQAELVGRGVLVTAVCS
jgi:putative transposase